MADAYHKYSDPEYPQRCDLSAESPGPNDATDGQTAYEPAGAILLMLCSAAAVVAVVLFLVLKGGGNDKGHDK